MARARRKWNVFEFFPFVWLVYLYFPVMLFLSVPRPAWMYPLATSGLVFFLAVWLRAFAFGFFGWTDDLRWKIGGLALSLALFAAGYPVVGLAGVAFAIYGAALIGFTGQVRVAGWGLFAVLAVMLAPVWFLPGGPSWWEVVPYMAFAFVGWYANFASYRRMIADRRLRETQAEKEKLAQVAERERIARDLHDLLGHTLSVIVLKSELAAKLAERDPGRATQEIREVERISREALTEVRAAVRGYRSQGLNAELGRSKIALDSAEITLEYEGQALELPRPVEATMELVLREAVTNVVRHARATRCRIRLARVSGHFELEVGDDGVGGEGREGAGLAGMRERVRAVGGTLTRDGAHGTRLLARFPADRPILASVEREGAGSAREAGAS